MNSYGSVSLVSQAIYKVLRHMNWFSEEESTTAVVVNNPAHLNHGMDEFF
jgi:hypothetical protein